MTAQTALTLSGDDNTPEMPMPTSGVNHLRRLLAWMRCEFTLDEDMQRGYVNAAAKAVAAGIASPERAGEIIHAKAEQINRVPAYVRHAVKMLTRALAEHERRRGIVESPR